MNRHRFVPTLEGAPLESRAVPSAGLIRALGAPTDRSIPFVVAPPGVSQAALNFTTLRASQVLHGSGGGRRYQPGIYRSFDAFDRTGDLRQLNANLTRLAIQIPYGRQELLPLWRRDIAPLAVIPGAFGANARQLVLEDYVAYLREGIGTRFNYLVSRGSPNEFGFPTNGSVGR